MYLASFFSIKIKPEACRTEKRLVGPIPGGGTRLVRSSLAKDLRIAHILGWGLRLRNLRHEQCAQAAEAAQVTSCATIQSD